MSSNNFPAPSWNKAGQKKTTTTAKKKSYKNILLEDPPMYLIKPITNRTYMNGTYFKNMVDFIEDAEEDEVYAPSIGNMLMEVEEYELEALKDQDSNSYDTLATTAEYLMQALKVNLLFIVGHTEFCIDYMRTVNYTFKKPNNDLPLVIFIIGCQGGKTAADLNALQETRDKNYYFFGFHKIVHVVDGHIFMCEGIQREMPNMDCNYRGAKEDLKKLKQVRSMEEENENPLFQCMDAKYMRFVNTFKRQIRARNCIQFTTQNIIQKLNKFKDPERGFLPHDTFKKEDYIFRAEDGTPCQDATCSLQLYDGADQRAAEFDALIRIKTTRNEVKELIQKWYFQTVAEKRQADEQIVSHLNSLGIAEANSLLSTIIYEDRQVGYDDYVQSNIPLFEFAFLNKYELTSKEILTKYSPDWSKDKETYDGLIETLIERYPNSRNSYSIKELFRLFLKLKDKNHKLFFHFKDDVFLFKRYFEKPELLPLVQFYFRFFPGKTVTRGLSSGEYPIDYNTMFEKEKPLLEKFFENKSIIDNPRFFSILETLLIYGVDINKKMSTDETLIEYYENNCEGFYKPEFFRIYAQFGGNDPDLAKKIEIFEAIKTPQDMENYKNQLKVKQTKIRSDIKQYEKEYQREMNYRYNINNHNQITPLDERPRYMKLIKLLNITRFRINNLQQFIETSLQAYRIGQSTQPLSEETKTMMANTIIPSLDGDLANYIEGARAIPDVKDYFTEINKYLKKVNAPADITQAFQAQMMGIYKSTAGANENEGNSALRRLGVLRRDFEQFRRTYSQMKVKPGKAKQGGNITRRKRRT
jgi:hypothetical protein